MRVLLGLLFLFLAGSSADAAIIQINYTGAYSGTITTGNPAISQVTTVQVDSAPFSFQLVFNTLTPSAFYFDTPDSSGLFSGQNGPSAGFGGGPFFSSGAYHAEDTATTGFTSQNIVDLTISKSISHTPALFISVSHPDIPGSITEPFSILSGLTGTGSYHYDYTGVFFFSSQSFILTLETITVAVSGVPEASTWAMLLIGFAWIGAAAHRRRCATRPSGKSI